MLLFKKKERRRAPFSDVSEVREFVREQMHRAMDTEMIKGIPKAEREKYKMQQVQLRRAIRACVYGDAGEKLYVKRFIRNVLTEAELTNEERNRILPLRFPERMSAARKFDVLLYLEVRRSGKDAFLNLCDRYRLPIEVHHADGDYYEIREEDIHSIYQSERPALSEQDRMELFCDYVYEGFGNGIIDRLRDCKIDGISGGVSGLPEQFFRFEEELSGASMGSHSYDSVFVMVRGATVRLSFLSFESERELRRVTKSLLRYEAPGELSYYRPYMVNDMKDGSRVFACRPPFAESWAFFVRKFDSAQQKLPEELIVGKGADKVIQALCYFVGGGLHVAITGTQGSGKTTLLKTLVRYINPKYNLRIEEAVFELWMRREFPRRNILTFRETDSVGLTEGLNAFRKTDGNCLMMGEIGSIEVASLMIELSQVSEQQLFTHHAMTTEKLIGYFQNALLRTGAFSDEKLAREQVISAFQIHVLCEKDLSGKRCIRTISEIDPRDGKGIVLFRYEDGVYSAVNPPSSGLIEKMKERMRAADKADMMRFFGLG